MKIFLKNPNIEFKSMLLNKAENILALGTNEGTVKLYELNQFEMISELKPFKTDSSSKIF